MQLVWCEQAEKQAKGFGGGIGRRIEEARRLGTQYYVENLIVKPSCKVTAIQILARIHFDKITKSTH